MQNWLIDVYWYYERGFNMSQLFLFCSKGKVGDSLAYGVDDESIKDSEYPAAKNVWDEINLQEGINRMGKDW